MPAGNYIPGGASVLTAGACLIGTENKPVWFGLTAVGASAMARFWGSNGSTGGASLILPLIAGASMTVGPLGPFISACGIYVEGPSGAGASAFVWSQNRS